MTCASCGLTHPRVRCFRCGWTGENPHKMGKVVTTCPRCGERYARYAVNMTSDEADDTASPLTQDGCEGVEHVS